MLTIPASISLAEGVNGFIEQELTYVLLLAIDLTLFGQRLPVIILAVTTVLISRLIVVYGLVGAYNLARPRRSISRSYRHLMYWGGLRGAMSLALALILSSGPFSDYAADLKLMTFGVVLFTLMVQGRAIENLIKRLGTGGKPHHQLEQAMVVQAQADLLRAERDALSSARRRGLIGEVCMKSSSGRWAIAPRLWGSFAKCWIIRSSARMERIVCAIRGGRGTLVVRRMAIRLAREGESRLTFLSEVDTGRLLARSDKLKEAVRAKLYWSVDVFLRIAVQLAAREQVDASDAVREGPVRKTIVAFVREIESDLLLLGAPRGTTADLFGDDAIEQTARQIHEEIGVEVRMARPQMV